MVDTTPLNQNAKDDEPELENSRASIAAENVPHDTAPAESMATVPVSATSAGAIRSRRGLILAGGIVAAVIVLGGTFGGGVLVGTSVSSNHGITDARQGPGDIGAWGGPGGHQGGHQGGPGHQEGGQPGGPLNQGGPGNRDSTNEGTTNDGTGTGTGTGTGVNPTPAPGTGQGNGPRGGTDGSTGSTTG